MSQKKLTILLTFDLSFPMKPEEYEAYFQTEDWKSMAQVYRVLKKLGHEVKPFGIHNDIRPFIEEVEATKPDLVFNLSEAFADDRDFEPHLVALFELLNLRYTGAGAAALRLCKDKSLTKKILSFHGIAVPHFVVSKVQRPLKSLGDDFPYPAIVKPLKLEASEGISQYSIVKNEKEAIERIDYIHEKFNVDAIVEEYIDGREIYVSVLGNERVQVFPPRELVFREVPEGEPKVATYQAKWNDRYRKKWGIEGRFARGLSESDVKSIQDTAKNIYEALNLNGYARIDLRVREDGKIYFIEANPNPSIAREDDFALSAAKAGIEYDHLINKMIGLAGNA